MSGEKIANVFLVLPREGREGDGDRAATAREDDVALVNADEFGLGLFSLGVPPIPCLGDGPLANQTWSGVGPCGGNARGIVAGRRSKLLARGARRRRGLVDLLVGLQFANQLLVLLTELVERKRNELTVLEKRDVAIYLANELCPHRAAAGIG